MTLNSVKKQAIEIVREYDDGKLTFETMAGQLSALFVEVFEFGYKQGDATGYARANEEHEENEGEEVEFEADIDLDELRGDNDPGENGEEQ